MKPSIPRGTRDFGPAEMQKRNYIFSIIRKNFELFGYEPIETPSMEKAETLLGKYGDEGDKLVFRVLDSGDITEKLPDVVRSYEELREHSSNTDGLTKDFVKYQAILRQKTSQLYNNLKNLSEKALRYDLTVPFARYVVMNQHNLTFPFKRYQIQPVWRADRPQKGRYREFYQCDADIIGSDSLINELDLISLIDKSFSELKIPVILKINNRKILAGIAESIGAPERMIDIAVAIDKVDKIEVKGVLAELLEKGFSHEQINILNDLLIFKVQQDKPPTVDETIIGGKNKALLLAFSHLSVYKDNQVFQKGIQELAYLMDNNTASNINIELDFTLARGLNYYTGTIFEVKANAGTFTPSILGGGRYDDLTGIFGLPNMSGVGISFGVDRIYDVLEELNLFPDSISKISSTKLLFAHFDESNRDYCIPLANELRKNNISCEIYPDIVKKVAKQFDYANKKNIPFVCVIGSNEMQNKRYMLKDMSNGTQEEMSLEDIIKKLSL